jgi:hypothetical protein
MNSPIIVPTNSYLQYTRESFLGLRTPHIFISKTPPPDGHTIISGGIAPIIQIWEEKDYIPRIENITMNRLSTPLPLLV